MRKLCHRFILWGLILMFISVYILKLASPEVGINDRSGMPDFTTTEQTKFIVRTHKSKSKENARLMNIFNTRKKFVTEACERYKPAYRIPSLIQDRRPQYAFFIDVTRKLLVCGVPKSGSTSWQKVMTAMTNPGSFSSMEELDIGRRIYSMAPHLDTVSNLNETFLRNALLDDPEYVRVASFRHPLTRLYSAWGQKFKTNFVAFPYFWRKYGVDAVARFQNGLNSTKDQAYPLTFNSFIQYVADTGTYFSDWHWKSSVEYFCQPCHINYQYITFAETLSEEANYILHDLLPDKHDKYPVENWIRFPDRNSGSKSKNDIIFQAYKNVPKSAMDKIFQLYKNDFNILGFQKSI